jgi:hypothetical protein
VAKITNLDGAASIRPTRVEIHGVTPTGVGGPFLQERVTNGFSVITTDHGFIHEGIAYTLSGTATVDTTYSLAFTTPADNYLHFKPLGVSSTGGPVTVTIVEGATFVGGSDATPRNRNRLYADASATTCKVGVTPSGGTVIFTGIIPSTTSGNQRIGATSEAAEEWVLKQSTVYIMTLSEAATGTVLCGYELFWYEEESA